MMKIDLSNNQNSRQDQKNNRVHHRPEPHLPPVPVHDPLVKIFSQLTEPPYLTFSHEKPMHQFKAEEGFMIGRSDFCGRFLNPERVFFDLFTEDPDEKCNKGHHKEDQQRQFEIHHKEIDQENQCRERMLDQAQEYFGNETLQYGEVCRRPGDQLP